MNPVSFLRTHFNYFVPEGQRRAITTVLSHNIPTFAVLSIACLWSRVFLVGAAVGVVNTISSIALTQLLLKQVPPTQEDEQYVRLVTESVFKSAVIGPILEEVIFRGVLQPSLRWIVSVWLPDVSLKVAFIPPMALASMISVVATSVLFGFMHLTNNHSYKKFQALHATGIGIVYGVLAANYGLGASIGAHIMSNTILFINAAIARTQNH